MTSKDNKNNKPQPRCYNCDGYGHISKFCNNKKKTNTKGFAAVFSTYEQANNNEYVDCGASSHMTNVSDWMYDIRAAPINNIITNNISIPVHQMGNVNLNLYGEDGKLNHIQVRDIPYVAALLSVNLLSSCKVTFNRIQIYNKQNQYVKTARLTSSCIS